MCRRRSASWPLKWTTRSACFHDLPLKKAVHIIPTRQNLKQQKAFFSNVFMTFKIVFPFPFLVFVSRHLDDIMLFICIFLLFYLEQIGRLQGTAFNFFKIFQGLICHCN